MANKTKATPEEGEAREQGPEIPGAPLPLLDLTDAAIKQATKRGYVIPPPAGRMPQPGRGGDDTSRGNSMNGRRRGGLAPRLQVRLRR